jgi:hypothetical protein
MRQQGERLKRHLRETDTMTWCGRRRGTVVSRGANGVERWLNGSHIIETTDRLEDVECEKCK